MVWKDSKEFAMAYSGDYVIALYYPPGNRGSLSEIKENV